MRKVKRCKVKINLKKFETIQLYKKQYGFIKFNHCLN